MMAEGAQLLDEVFIVEMAAPEAQVRKGKLGDKDSNLDKQNQNLLCYRYTIAQKFACCGLVV